MAKDFSKILDHPDSSEIIDKLLKGTTPKELSDQLKLKYTKKEQTHLRVSAKLLKEFVDENLNLQDHLETHIQEAKEGKLQDKKIFESLQNTKSYAERLNELADTKIDIKKVVMETVFLLRERIEQVFDRIQENPSQMKPDHVLIKYFDTLLNATEKFDKIVNQNPDQVIQHNITMQALDQRSAIVQDVIREVLAEMDPEAAFMFMERLQVRLGELDTNQKAVSDDKLLAEAKIINKRVKDDEA